MSRAVVVDPKPVLQFRHHIVSKSDGTRAESIETFCIRNLTLRVLILQRFFRDCLEQGFVEICRSCIVIKVVRRIHSYGKLRWSNFYFDFIWLRNHQTYL